LREISELISSGSVDPKRAADSPIHPLGETSERDVLPEYAGYLRELVPVENGRPLTVVVDAGNGMGGFTVPAVLGTGAGLTELPLTIIPMYFELDGSFPNHEANPIEPANLVDLQKAVIEHKADLGLAFDGDADRCFVIDENGDAITPSAITALIATRELARHPGSNVIHNLITSRTVPEVIKENGGTAIRTRVGHSFIKATMAETNAVFGGEHSGHFYFRDFWRADSGMLAALHCIAALGETTPGTTFSSLMIPFNRYEASGEINTRVDNQARVISAMKSKYLQYDLDELDGLTVSADSWWFNVRASNTEPLLRLNVEARDLSQMQQLRDEVLELMNAPTEPISSTASGIPWGIAPELWNVLACPCPAHGELMPGTDSQTPELVCTVCGVHFPVRDGIPVMLLP
jgi:phosphomannomutase